MNKITRARFLKLLLGATAVTTFPLISCEKQAAITTNNNENQIDIIIIGAGIAGISAGFELVKKGFKVLILEARDRIGGRIWTNDKFNIPLDLGASWIHESEGNPLSQLVEQFQIKTVSFDYDDTTTYYADGSQINEEDESYYEELFDQIFEQLETLRNKREDEDQEDISLGEAITEILKNEDLDQEDLTVINYLLNTTIEHEYAGDLNNLSLYYWDNDQGFDGEDLIFPQGYSQILQPMVKDLTIQLNQIVQKIDYTNQIEVTTNQGIFKAKYGIFTLPLGVLKAGKVEFLPPLPNQKKEAINHLKMGVLNKVYLKFPEVFWDDSQMLEYISNNKGEWCEWANFQPIINQPILLGFNAANYGSQIEEYSDQEIIESALNVLKTIYKNVPDPVDYLITRWHKDQFSYGSYSYLPVGATPEDYDHLAQAIDDKLFFAGEATSKDYFATVHGAFLSGKRVANEILAINN
jgi:monoamine oxidase